jgi:hypothetical protein
MSATRIILLIFLIVGFLGCKNYSRERQMKALLNEAQQLMKRDTDVTGQWSDEFVKVFTPENRAQFPANRDVLRTHAVQIIKLLDESSSLNNRAADKYEQAAGLSDNDQQRRGLTTFASGFRKSAEGNDLIKSQMQMVSDETVLDQKIFNERLLHSWQLIKEKQHERNAYFDEGKRLLGW